MNLKTFYAQLFTLWSTYECCITRAEHLPKIQLPRIALSKTTMFPTTECWYPADRLVNRCYKNSQKNQKHCTCSFILCMVIYCVCFFLWWNFDLLKRIDLDRVRRNFFVIAKENRKKNFVSLKLRATVPVFCATGVLIFKNCRTVWKVFFKHIAFLLTKIIRLIVNARKTREFCIVWWNWASWDV